MTEPGAAAARVATRPRPALPDGLRVGLVHEWVLQWGGSESVVRSLANLFPGAPLHVAVSDPDETGRATLGTLDIRPSRLQAIPTPLRNHRWLLPLMPGAFGAMDMSAYDLVLSSSHAFSKAVRVPDPAVHVCYCHTPPRYLWDLAGFYNRGVTGALRAPLLRRLRRQDLQAARRVDHFVANSKCVAERIERTYGREAPVIYPPVDIDRFALATREPGGYYLAGGRMVAYKRLEVAVEAANRAGFHLKVFGSGPEEARLRALAGPTVEFLGRVDDGSLHDLVSGARAFLFPGEEDFGILPVEVQAVGRPVVGWGRGGARETVLDGRTGVLYDDPSARALLGAIERLEGAALSPLACRRNAERFGRPRFEREMADFILDLPRLAKRAADA